MVRTGCLLRHAGCQHVPHLEEKRGEAQFFFFAGGCEHLRLGTLSQPAAVIV